MKSLTIALIALICYALAWVFNAALLSPVIGIVLSIVCFVLSIMAYVTGKNALKADPGDGKAKAGKIIGLIFMILGIIGIVAMIAIMAIAGFAVASIAGALSAAS
jgi:hypothetical protein